MNKNEPMLELITMIQEDEAHEFINELLLSEFNEVEGTIRFYEHQEDQPIPFRKVEEDQLNQLPNLRIYRTHLKHALTYMDLLKSKVKRYVNDTGSLPTS